MSSLQLQTYNNSSKNFRFLLFNTFHTAFFTIRPILYTISLIFYSHVYLFGFLTIQIPIYILLFSYTTFSLKYLSSLQLLTCLYFSHSDFSHSFSRLLYITFYKNIIFLVNSYMRKYIYNHCLSY